MTRISFLSEYLRRASHLGRRRSHWGGHGKAGRSPSLLLLVVAVLLLTICTVVGSISVARFKLLERDLHESLAVGMTMQEVEHVLETRRILYWNPDGRQIMAYPVDTLGFAVLPFYMRVNIYLNDSKQVVDVRYIHSLGS